MACVLFAPCGNTAIRLDHSKQAVRGYRPGTQRASHNMAIDALQRLDRFDFLDVQLPARFGHDVAAVMRRGRHVLLPIALLWPQHAARARGAGIGLVIDEIRDGLTDSERQSQKGA